MTHPDLDRLLADVGAPVRRIVFARGVEARRDDEAGAWHLPAAFPRGAPGAGAPAAALAALGLRPVDDAAGPAAFTPLGTPSGAAPRRACPECAHGPDPVALATQHGLAPRLLVTASALGVETTHVVSAMGDVGWMPPLERLHDHAALGARARRTRFLLDAMEHHAACAAECYVTTATAARRTAALFGGHELTSLAGQTTLFVELDALLHAVQRTYLAAGRLLVAAFPTRARAGTRAGAYDARANATRDFDALVLSARRAPAELRETLLAAWDANGAHAREYRRALLRRDARERGQAPVRLARVHADVWTVSVPLTAGVDALDRAWALATDAMRVVALIAYAVERG